MKQGWELRKFDRLVGNDGQHWKKIGETRCGTWVQFVPDLGDGWKSDRPARTLHTSPKPAFVPKRPQGTDRDQWLQREFGSLTLDPIDRADLVRRGFSDDEITATGAVTFWKGTGYVIPTRDWNGRLTGAQIRLRESASGGRYRWSHKDLQLAGGEMPLQILKGDPTKPTYWIEGTGAKPWKVHFETGATVIGAAGGNFGSCAEQVRTVLVQTKSQKQVLLPDGGSVLNTAVIKQYQRLDELVPDLQIQWWEQLEKSDGDADENTDWINGIRLTSTEFFSDEFRQSVHEQVQLRQSLTLTIEPQQQSSGNFLPSGTIGDQPVIAIAAPMGSGKTEAITEKIKSDQTKTLLATHRRNLSRNAAGRTGLTYLQEGEAFDGKTGEKLFDTVPAGGDTSCIDSWHPFGSLRRTPDEIDSNRVVLDEIDQVLNHVLSASTCRKERVDILNTLHEGLPRTQQLIAASATLDDITIEWLSAVTEKPVHLIRHQSTATPWAHSFLENESNALGQIVSSISRGENVLIATSDAGDEGKFSRIGAQNLLKYLRQTCSGLNDTNSDAFTSASIAAATTDSRQKLFMRDPVSAVRKLQVAIYSPVAETGIDINLKGHFQKVFVLSSGFTMTPQAVVQSAARLRDPNALRLLLIPRASCRQKGHGITDWQELLMTVIDDSEFNAARFDVLRSNSLRNNVAPFDCPHLRAWSKLEIRKELMAKHYRFAVTVLLNQLGSERKTASVTTQQDQVIAKSVRQFTRNEKSKAALAVIESPLPNTAEYEVASPEQKTAGRRRQKLETFTGKRLSRETTSETEVLQTEKALKPLKLRFLMSQPELAMKIDEAAAKNSSGWEPEQAQINTARKVEALILMGAPSLLQQQQTIDGSDPRVIKLNEFIGAHAGMLQRLFGKKPKQYTDPIRALSWLASLVGMKLEAVEQITVNGKRRHRYQLLEAFDQVNAEEVLKHWSKHPELFAVIPTAQKSVRSNR